MKRLAGALVLFTGLLRASSSSACQPPGLELAAHSPAADETGVALNAPVVMHFDLAPQSNLTFSNEQVSGAYVKLIEPDAPDSIATTALKLVPSYGAVKAHITSAPLKPNTKYHAMSSLGVEWDFTTGAAARDALRVEGELKVRYQLEDEPVYECSPSPMLGSCGIDSCTTIGTKQVTKAYLTLPAVHGGFADQHLEGVVWISPFEAEYERWPVVAGQTNERVLTMAVTPDRLPYQACFTYEAMDARGDLVQSTELCVAEDVPVPAEPIVDVPEPDLPVEPDLPWTEPGNPPIVVDEPDHPIGDIGTPPDDADATPDTGSRGPRNSTSCSIGHGASRAAGHGRALAALALLGALTRRRRTRSSL